MMSYKSISRRGSPTGIRRNTFVAKSPFGALLWTGGAPLLHPEKETMIGDLNRTYLQEPSPKRKIGCIQDAPKPTQNYNYTTAVRFTFTWLRVK
jgi:hypothetical protein